MSLVRGINMVVEIYDGGVWKQFVCARDVNMSIDTDFIETTVTGSGDDRTFEPTVRSASCEFSGITALNMPGFITLPELHAFELSKQKLLFRIVITSEDLSTYTRQFYTFVQNVTDTASFDGIATFQLSSKVTGKITQIFTPPSPTTGTMYRYPAMGSTAPTTPGEQSITVPGLGNKNILGVWKDGVGNNDIILSGTPVGKEVLYETVGADGLFTWAIPFDGENWFCQYQNT